MLLISYFLIIVFDICHSPLSYFIFVICSFSSRTVIVRASIHCFLAHLCQRKEQLILFSELQSSLEYYIVCKHIREPPGPQCFLFKGPPNVLLILQDTHGHQGKVWLYHLCFILVFHVSEKVKKYKQ